MSRREWERGEIVIPANQWSKFKKSFREAYNKALQEDLKMAERAIEAVKTSHKGKRNVDWKSALAGELDRQTSGYSSFYGSYQNPAYPLSVLEPYQISQKALTHKETTSKTGEKKVQVRLGTLKKMHFPLANSKTTYFDRPYSEIKFVDKTHTLIWSVSEGNHYCERAREDGVAEILFKLLEEVQWSRNAGGCIVGNDELNRDNSQLGGAENYLKGSYGPLGEKEAARQTGYVFRRRPR